MKHFTVFIQFSIVFPSAWKNYLKESKLNPKSTVYTQFLSCRVTERKFRTRFNTPKSISKYERKKTSYKTILFLLHSKSKNGELFIISQWFLSRYTRNLVSNFVFNVYQTNTNNFDIFNQWLSVWYRLSSIN